MAIDISVEQPVSLTEATKFKNNPVRRAGKRPCVSTFYRWATVGVRGVKLETIVCGGARCTTQQALQRFFDRLTGPDAADGPEPATAPTPIVTNRQRRAAIAKAEAELARAGI